MEPSLPPIPQPQNPSQPPPPQYPAPVPTFAPEPPKSNKNKKIILIIIAVLVLLIGVAGVYFWQDAKSNSQRTSTEEQNNSLTADQEDEVASESQAPADSTADWVAYQSPRGEVSLKHPKAWVTADDPELCGGDMVILGANKESLGKCGSDSSGQMAIVWTSFEMNCGFEDSTNYENISQTEIVADGVTGSKSSATVKENSEGIGPEAGTKITKYCFKKGPMSYMALYVHDASYPDVTADFETLVTKTLEFN